MQFFGYSRACILSGNRATPSRVLKPKTPCQVLSLRFPKGERRLLELLGSRATVGSVIDYVQECDLCEEYESIEVRRRP